MAPKRPYYLLALLAVLSLFLMACVACPLLPSLPRPEDVQRPSSTPVVATAAPTSAPVLGTPTAATPASVPLSTATATPQFRTGGATPTTGVAEIPIYPGAKDAVNVSPLLKGIADQQIQRYRGDYRTIDVRWYSTADPPAKVIAYYETAMPNRGWSGAFGDVGVQDVSLGAYQKGAALQAGVVVIGGFMGGQGQGCLFVLLRGEK